MPHSSEASKGWSTRQLADMAGSTVKAIRHYHRCGLLAEPRRRDNGYKAYEPEHLSQLLIIVRMRQIGFSVARIAEALRSDDLSTVVTRRLIEEVDTSIARLETIRQELVASMESPEHWQVPPDFGDVADHLSHADRLTSQVMARHFTPEAMAALRSQNATRTPVDAEFEQLPADASAEAITDVADRMAPHIRRAQAEHPMPGQVVSGDRSAATRAARALGRTLSELYNPAQVAVVVRALADDEHADRPA